MKPVGKMGREPEHLSEVGSLSRLSETNTCFVRLVQLKINRNVLNRVPLN